MLPSLAGFVLLSIPAVWVVRTYGFGRRFLSIASPVTALMFGHLLFFVYPAFAYTRTAGRDGASTMLAAAVLSTAVLVFVIAITRAQRRGWSDWAIGTVEDARTSGIPEVHAMAATKAVLVLTVVNVIALYLMYRTVGGWPFLDVLRGGSGVELRRARFDVTRGQNPIVALAPVAFAPIVVASLTLTRGKVPSAWTPVRVACAAVAVLVATFPGNKLPFALLLIAWYVGSQWQPRTKGTSPTSRRYWSTILLAVGISAYTIFVFRNLGVVTGGIVETIQHDVIGRATRDPADANHAVFASFPEQTPYTNFLDINEVAVVLDEPWRNLSRETAQLLGRRERTNAPPSTLGRFYAQSGFLMLTVGWTVVATLFVWAENHLLRADRLRTFLGRIWWVMLTIAGVKASISDAYQLAASETVLPVGLFSLLFLLILGPGRRQAPQRSSPVPAARSDAMHPS